MLFHEHIEFDLLDPLERTAGPQDANQNPNIYQKPFFPRTLKSHILKKAAADHQTCLFVRIVYNRFCRFEALGPSDLDGGRPEDPPCTPKTFWDALGSEL